MILSDQRSYMFEIIPMTPEDVTLDPPVPRHYPRIFRSALEHPRQDLSPIRPEYFAIDFENLWEVRFHHRPRGIVIDHHRRDEGRCPHSAQPVLVDKIELPINFMTCRRGVKSNRPLAFQYGK